MVGGGGEREKIQEKKIILREREISDIYEVPFAPFFNV